MTKRFLCVCRAGSVRSVCLASLLKQGSQDAVAVGWETNSPELLHLLAQWADYILLARPEFLEKCPESFRTTLNSKVRLLDIGKDVWHDPNHPDLIRKLIPVVTRWYDSDWVLE